MTDSTEAASLFSFSHFMSWSPASDMSSQLTIQAYLLDTIPSHRTPAYLTMLAVKRKVGFISYDNVILFHTIRTRKEALILMGWCTGII